MNAKLFFVCSHYPSINIIFIHFPWAKTFKTGKLKILKNGMSSQLCELFKFCFYVRSFCNISNIIWFNLYKTSISASKNTARSGHVSVKIKIREIFSYRIFRPFHSHIFWGKTTSNNFLFHFWPPSELFHPWIILKKKHFSTYVKVPEIFILYFKVTIDCYYVYRRLVKTLRWHFFYVK